MNDFKIKMEDIDHIHLPLGIRFWIDSLAERALTLSNKVACLKSAEWCLTCVHVVYTQEVNRIASR